MNPILDVRNLEYHYGEIYAVKNISFSINEGEIVAIIGSNGAGKTTTLRAINGLLGKISGGEIHFDGHRIDTMPTHKITGLGLCQVLEGRIVFPQLTVRENLMMGAFLQKDKVFIKNQLDYVCDLFPRLLERENQNAGTLSGGEQQMLAVARALMSKPKMLMMDEPSMGLAPLVVKDIFSTIEKINNDGVTILLVEQNARAALKIANRAYVIETGELIMEGSAHELLEDKAVQKAYLGVS
ncbi:MAG: ABC transporter ATP-binding protein [Saccharofermentanales bacterium]|jgi:branched-chain amino acid transport system ATP-binding protein